MSFAIANSGKTNASQAAGLTNLSKNMTNATSYDCQPIRSCIENCTKIQNCTMFEKCIQSCAASIEESQSQNATSEDLMNETVNMTNSSSNATSDTAIDSKEKSLLTAQVIKLPSNTIPTTRPSPGSGSGGSAGGGLPKAY
jgi:hypothetical protein